MQFDRSSHGKEILRACLYDWLRYLNVFVDVLVSTIPSGYEETNDVIYPPTLKNREK